MLQRWEWSETSQIVSLFLREHGVIRGVAKGARRPRAHYSGGFEPMTFGEAVLYVRRTASLATIAEWDLQEVFWGPRRSLSAHYTGLYAIDLARHMMAEQDPHPTLWDALALLLREIGRDDRDPLRLMRYQWSVLVDCGHQPDLDPATLAAGVEGSVVGLDVDAGRLAPDPGPGHAPNGQWRVRRTTVELIREIAAMTAAGALPVCDPSVAARANRLLASYCARIVGRRIRIGTLY